MFAVLKTNSSDVVEGHAYCCCLSKDRKSADEFVAGRNDLSSNGRYAIHEISTLEELSELMVPFGSESEPDILAELLKQIDDLKIPENAEKFVEQIQTQGEKAVAEVRSLGIRGMRAVGEGFVALGDLLRKASPEDEQK